MPDDARRPSFDKSRMPSRHVTVGPERAPHRSFLYSMGLSDEQIAQPLVGVATTWNEVGAVQHLAVAPGAGGKKGGRGLGRHAARIHHDHRHRRHRDGP